MEFDEWVSSLCGPFSFGEVIPGIWVVYLLKKSSPYFPNKPIFEGARISLCGSDWLSLFSPH